MNTKNKSGFHGFGIYVVLILLVVFIWYWVSGNTATSNYTRSDFESDLQKGTVASVQVQQNREIPTGSLKIKMKDDKNEILYVSDVNEIQALMDEYKFTRYTCDDVPAESWIMTLLPYLLVFGAIFILFMIANNNAITIIILRKTVPLKCIVPATSLKFLKTSILNPTDIPTISRTTAIPRLIKRPATLLFFIKSRPFYAESAYFYPLTAL